MKILNRYTKVLILETQNTNLCDADLCGVNLCDADLYGVNLCGVNLCNANLCEANLRNANLRNADLYNADLCRADLYDADFREANLCGANLCHTNLHKTNLHKANLTNITLNWQSHTLISQLIFNWAQQCPHKRAIAGLIHMSTDWCWNDFLKLNQFQYYIETFSYLKTLIKPNDNHPPILDQINF